MRKTKNHKSNFCKLFLAVGLAFAGCSTFALTSKHVSGEATVLDFDWRPASELPGEIQNSRILSRWKRNFSADVRGWAEFDLDGDSRTKDVIIDDFDFPSGGRAFLLLSKRWGVWHELASFRGAPVFSERDEGNFPELQVYWRSGDIRVIRLKMKNDRYVRIDEYTIPRMINNECFYRQWQEFNLAGRCKPRPSPCGCRVRSYGSPTPEPDPR